MTSKTYFGIGSLLTALTISGCMLGGSEMSSEPYDMVSEEHSYEDARLVGNEEGEALVDAQDPILGYGATGDDDAPTTPPVTPEGRPLFAQADDDSSDCEEPTPKDEVTLQKVARDLTNAKKPKDRMEIQQAVIEEGIKDADNLNDELAVILEQLRQEQGLQKEDPYVSPIQEVVEPILEEEGAVEANPAKYTQQVQEALEDPEIVVPEDDDDCDEEIAAPPQNQDQNQADLASDSTLFSRYINIPFVIKKDFKE